VEAVLEIDLDQHDNIVDPNRATTVQWERALVTCTVSVNLTLEDHDCADIDDDCLDSDMVHVALVSEGLTFTDIDTWSVVDYRLI
jgi:hypothetical protein